MAQLGTHNHTSFPRSLGREQGHRRGDLDKRENVVGKFFLFKDQGGRGITVAVASGVVTWLHWECRHKRRVGRRVGAMYQNHRQSTSVNGYVYMRDRCQKVSGCGWPCRPVPSSMWPYGSSL